MPEIFIPFGAFAPEGGDVGDGLVRADNAVPIHRGHRPLRQRQDIATLGGDGPVTGAFVHIFQAEETEQHAVPVADEDVHTGSVGNDGRTADLYELVDEETPDDGDYIVFGGGSIGELPSWQGSLGPLVDPAVDTGHVVHLRYRLAGGADDWRVSVDIIDAGAGAVADFDLTGTGDTDGWVDHEETLATLQVANLVNYDALAVRITVEVNDSGADLPAQFGRPAADLALNGWTDQAGSSSSVYQAIDESSASDSDYAQSPPLLLGGARSKYRAALADLIDPLVKNEDVGTYTLRYRYKTTNTGVTVKVTLGRGGSANGTGGTVIASQEHSAVTPGSFIAGSLVVNEEMWEVEGQHYDDLWLEFEAYWPTAATSTATQTVVPTADIEDDDWTPSSGATLWEAIDADDGVSVTAASPGIGGEDQVMVVAVPTVDPGVDVDHVLTVKAAAASAGTASFRVELLQGENIIFGDNFTRNSLSLTNEVIPITAFFTSQISDYSQLRLKIIDRGGSGSSGVARCKVSYAKLETTAPRRAQISWAELETPPTAQGHVSLVNLSVPAVVTAYEGDKPTMYAGSRAALYAVTSAGFEDVSKSGGYGEAVTGSKGGAWRFAQIGNHVIATDGDSPVQWREDQAGDFKDLITAPSPAPTARFVAPWRERLLLGSIGLTGHAVDEIWVSSANDIQDFEPSEETRAGFEPIRSRPGQLMGLIGGQEGILFKRNSIHQMLYTGGSTLFRIEDVTKSVGVAYPSSLIEHGDYFYFFSGEAFWRGTIEGIERIGDGSVTQLLTDAENLDESIAHIEPGDIALEDQVMVGTRCPRTGLLMWTYQAKTDEPWRHSRGVLYNPVEDRWAPITGSFDVSALTHTPNTFSSDTYLLSRISGFSWDGTDSTWFKWAGPTQEVVFDTKLRRLPSSTDAVRDPVTGRFAEPPAEPMNVVRAVRPVFSFPRKDGAVPLPDIASVTCTGWRDADRTSSLAIEQEATPGNRNDRGIWNFGRGVHGFYHTFRVVLAESASNAIYNLVGLWVEYQTAGRR